MDVGTKSADLNVLARDLARLWRDGEWETVLDALTKPRGGEARRCALAIQTYRALCDRDGPERFGAGMALLVMLDARAAS